MRKYRGIYILFVLFVFHYRPVQGQQLIRFQNISVDDGLSMGTITGVQKDQDGYIWIATAEGLHRYDGKKFKIFKHIDGETNSLSDSYVRSLLVVGKQLFLGNNSGLIDILDLYSYQVNTIGFSDLDPLFDYPVSVIEVFGEQLLIGTEGGGLWTYHLQHKKLSKLKNAEFSAITIVNGITINGSHFYVSTPQRIYKCNLNSCQVFLEMEEGGFSAMELWDNTWLIATAKGLYRVSKDGSEITEMALPAKKRRINRITDIVVVDSIAWVSTHGGLLRYCKNSMLHYEYDPIRPYTLINNQINNLYFDKDRILWVGTISGLSKYASKLKKFELLQYFDFEGKTYNNNVYYIYPDRQGHVWLGTLSSGMIELDQQHQIVNIYPVIRDGTIETKAVRAIFQDSDGIFWVGTRDEGLFIFDQKRKKFKHVPGKAGGKLNNNIIRSIYEDRKKRLWIGTQDGLSLYDKVSGLFINYKAEPQSTTNNAIYQITQDAVSGNLILASFRGGLQIFNPETKRFVSMKKDTDDSSSLSNNNVMSLEWLNKDTLLIGTYGGGLNIYDLKSKTFRHITEKNGLINNAIYGILYEGKGNCWLSTNNGIVSYNIYEHSFTNFKPGHYLQSTEFNEGAFAQSANGWFYFAGVNGLNYFRPQRIAYDTIRPPLYITEIRGNYTRESVDEIDLSFLNSRLEIDFMALYYINPEGVHYRYRMVGYDQDWIDPKYSNTAVYPRLSPGSYRFEVMATDEFGHWMSKPILLNVHVEPPFWQKWWFILLSIFSIAGLVIALFRYRTNEIKRGYKHQLVDSELRALRSQMNPHFIFNSLNSIQYFILKKQPQEAYTYLSKFASLMRKILQNSRLKYITVKDEAEWLELYLEMEKLRMDNKLEYYIVTDKIADTESVYIPTMLIQPYVENSIVHGLLSKTSDRQIHIHFYPEEDHIVCIVEDNGIGREASRILNKKRARKHESAGMALTEKRLEILSEGKGDFDVRIEDLKKGGKACGTRVRIIIPRIEKGYEQ